MELSESNNTITGLAKRGNGPHLELLPFKVSMDQLGQIICGFLNSGGGQILLGIDRFGDAEELVQKRKVSALLDSLRAREGKPGLLVPEADWSFTMEAYQDHQVALIDIRDGGDPPYIYGDEIYVRDGDRTLKATALHTRSLVEKRSQQGIRWERASAPFLKPVDFDWDAILQAGRTSTERNDITIRNLDDPMQILHDLGLTTQGQPNNAALALFAKNPVRFFPQLEIRATVCNSDKDAADLRDDQVFNDHLFGNLKSVTRFVERHVSVTSDFSLVREQRLDRPTIPMWSLREALRNALMHRDYSAHHGQLMISVFPQRLEIWSYGRLPEGLEIKTLSKSDQSMPVNPDIARTFFRCGLTDRLGRGTRKIAEECKLAGLPMPKWREVNGGIQLTIYGLAGARELPAHLNQRQVGLLMRTRPGEQITMAVYQERNGSDVSDRTGRTDLNGLVRLGFFDRRGKGKNTFYVRTEKPLA